MSPWTELPHADLEGCMVVVDGWSQLALVRCVDLASAGGDAQRLALRAARVHAVVTQVRALNRVQGRLCVEQGGPFQRLDADERSGMAEVEAAETLAAAAQAAYEAYREAVGGRDPYQHPMEEYGDLHDVYKQAWTDAAQAVLSLGVTYAQGTPQVDTMAAPSQGLPGAPEQLPTEPEAGAPEQLPTEPEAGAPEQLPTEPPAESPGQLPAGEEEEPAPHRRRR